jgi:FKBP-type peptidyl-prolyl cis-trans isomerase FklB
LASGAAADAAAAGKKFLEENKKKDGIITLASGLQYKVLREGIGMEHPQVGTPCECHYAGRLLDGTEFDSSYKRGSPTTFAPNQVIKGWTEAMQLMVQGDKWEMYIPYDLAYGKSGKPPKIPPAACLVFVMEIMKIKGATVPAQIVFPEWTPEQLALWTEKDEASCTQWRETKEKSYEEGGKLKEQHPAREEFDVWLDKQCLTAKNKSLWKRTRKNEEPQAEEKKGPPQLTKETARELLTKALDTFKLPANKDKLEGIVKECEGADAAQAGMMKMMKLLPVVQEMVGGLLIEYGNGSGDLMTVTSQIQAFAPEDPSIAADTGKLMKAVQGDFADIFAE